MSSSATLHALSDAEFKQKVDKLADHEFFKGSGEGNTKTTFVADEAYSLCLWVHVSVSNVIFVKFEHPSQTDYL